MKTFLVDNFKWSTIVAFLVLTCGLELFHRTTSHICSLFLISLTIRYLDDNPEHSSNLVYVCLYIYASKCSNNSCDA